jgi:Novel STAND NTPase 1
MGVELPEAPYKGLSFYTEEDAPFFFGRERETHVVAANLMASRLTLLYGESGVGKSSLLRAGVGRHFHELAHENIERRGTPRCVVVLFPNAPLSWSDDPITAIAVSIERAVSSLLPDVEPPSRTLPFCDLLAAWVERLGSDLLIVLDQFEEYLLYHEGEDGAGTLASELPRAIGRPALRASFLISIREDALARLDRFKSRIPALFENYLRVNHLDRGSARDAIVKPIERYNELAGDRPAMAIEPQLVETLLDDLETGRVTLGLVGLGVSEAQTRAATARRVETPYLQLVMTRLWSEEVNASSAALRIATLQRLGGCRRIVETHLDQTMRALPSHSRYVAARVFRHLVTPSGMKIAHTAADLAAYGGLAEAEVKPVLQRLTAGDTRVLRRVESSERDQAPARFEIFHDVLAAAILDWRARYRGTAPPYIRAATAFHLLVAALWIFLLTRAARNLKDAFGTPYLASRPSALVASVSFLWMVAALAFWLRTTVVLNSSWRRRNGWAVPVVGAFAAAIAPAAIAATALCGVARRTTSRVHTGDRSLRRFSALAAIAGAAVMLAACAVPMARFRWSLAGYSEIAKRTLYGPFLSQTYVRLGADLWLVLQLIIIAAAVVVTAALVLNRSVGRRLAAGFVAALAVGVLAYVAGFSFWTDAAEPVLRHPSRGELLRLLCGPDSIYSCTGPTMKWVREGHVALSSNREIGGLVASAGAVLILVAAAAWVSMTRTLVRIFAMIVGAARLVGDGAEGSLTADAVVPERRRAAASLAIGGAGVVLAACLIPSGGWSRDASASLVDISAWAAFQALVPALGAALVAALLLVRPPDPRLGAGLLAGSGLASLALFTAILGSAVDKHGADAPPGGYIGIAGSAFILASAAILYRAQPIPSPAP